MSEHLGDLLEHAAEHYERPLPPYVVAELEEIAYARVMWRSASIGAVLMVLAMATASRADTTPEPEEGDHAIERTVWIDESGLPEKVKVSLFMNCGRIKGESTWTRGEPIPNRDDCHLAILLGDWVSARRLPLPPLQEVESAVDPRTRVQARYRPTVVDGRLEAGLFELVFFDASGAVLCRRPPLTEPFDPCDPTTPRKKALHYAKRYGWIPGGLALLVGGGWLVRRVRRRRVARRAPR